MFKKSLVFIIIGLLIGILIVPTSISYSKTGDLDYNNINFNQPNLQSNTSSTGGLIVGPFLIAKISANFSKDVGWVKREGRFIAFEFGPYGIGYVNLRPLGLWDEDPYHLYSNTTGETVSHRFWVGAYWFFGTVKYVDDRILINGWCFRIIMFVDFFVMEPDLTINPVDDAYVDAYHPDQNFGDSEVLEVSDHNGTETGRTYVKFDLSSIPDEVTIHYALIQFYYCDSKGGGEPKVGVYQVNTNWDEDLITWDDQPEFSQTCEHYILLSQYDPWRTEHLDITDLVRGWKSGSIPNNGVVVKFCQPCENDITRRIFRSKEWNVENERPVLKITYY